MLIDIYSGLCRKKIVKKIGVLEEKNKIGCYFGYCIVLKGYCLKRYY